MPSLELFGLRPNNSGFDVVLALADRERAAGADGLGALAHQVADLRAPALDLHGRRPAAVLGQPAATAHGGGREAALDRERALAVALQPAHAGLGAAPELAPAQDERDQPRALLLADREDTAGEAGALRLRRQRRLRRRDLSDQPDRSVRRVDDR